MAKIRKAVFRSGSVMLSLLAAIVLSSSVAQAQRCEVRAATGDNAVANVRAEGMTEDDRRHRVAVRAFRGHRLAVCSNRFHLKRYAEHSNHQPGLT